MESIPLNWKPLEILHDSVEQCMAGTNWQALCSRASHLNHNEPCVMLKLMTTGLNHLIRLLRFSSSKTIWVVKIPIKQTVDKGPDRGLQAEVDVMCLLHERTSIGVPRILDYELTTENTAGVAFMLMEFLPGNAAMDTFGGWESHHGTIPPEYRHGFYSSIAKRQARSLSTDSTVVSTNIVTGGSGLSEVSENWYYYPEFTRRLRCSPFSAPRWSFRDSYGLPLGVDEKYHVPCYFVRPLR